jgi:hypothetical protein
MQNGLNQKLINILGKGLGVFWLFDGLLQLQPKMFGIGFVNNVLVPNLTGQPAFLHSIIAWGINIFFSNIVAANSFAAALQILIGILLLLPIQGMAFKTGLYLSVVWGMVVWIFGEGLGNLFTGSASLYTGAPGAALIYAFISACLLMSKKINSRFFAKMAALILLLGAALQLQPMFWNFDGTQMVFQLSAGDAVHVINALPTFLSAMLSAHPAAFNWFLIIVPLLLAMALLLKPNRTTASVIIIFLLLVWWLGQDFGGLSTLWVGTATDPNAAPLITLLIFPMLFDFGISSDER